MNEHGAPQDGTAAHAPRAFSAWRSLRARNDLVVGAGVLALFALVAARVEFNNVIPALGRVLGHGWADELFVGIVLVSLLGVAFSVRRAVETDVALRRLNELHALSRVSFDDSPLPMSITDPETFRFLAVNDAVVREYGWSREDFTFRMTILDLYADARRPEIARRLREVPVAAHMLQGVTHRRKDGTEARLDIMRAPLQYLGRDAVLSVAINVTEREQLADERRNSRARYEAIFNTATAGIVESDSTGRIVDCNEAFAGITGRPRSDLLGRNVYDITEPEDVPAGRALLADICSGARSGFTQSKRYVRPDGSRVWVLVTATAVAGRTDGEDGRIIGVVIDSTEREQLAQQNRESLARFAALFGTAAAGITEVEAPGVLIDCNDTFARMLGYQREELIGRHVNDITHPADRDESTRRMSTVFTGALPTTSQV